MAKEILVAYGVDVDAVAGQIGSYAGGDSPCDISRGLFAGEVGTRRLLKLFDKHDITTTWFIPGHSIETFPEDMKAVADKGHEIGMHGYTHENPIAMSPEQEEAVMLKSISLIEELSGRRPTGYVAPWWEFSPITNELLLKHGIKYDHSLMNDDFHCHRVRVGDSWKLIDYSADAETWMEPLKRGMAERSALKSYLALVHGEPTWEELLCESPVGPLGEGRLGVKEGGRAARSHFQVLARSRGFAALRVDLSTGRTHQIRIHLHSLGHPLVGEEWYRHEPCRLHLRQALHAMRLRVPEPAKRDLELDLAAPIPNDLTELLARLGLEAASHSGSFQAASVGRTETE